MSALGETAAPELELGASRGRMGDDGLVRKIEIVRKANGQAVRCLRVEPAGPAHGVVVISPGLGRTIRHGVFLALALAAEGFASLRFDLSNHIGDSDGEMVDATLSSAVEDWRAVVAAERQREASGPVLGVAASLSARAAVRAQSIDMTLSGLALVLPVVNFRRTVASVAGEDLVEACASGRIVSEDTVQILTHDMSGRFLRDALDNGFDGLESVRRELARITAPVSAVVAQDDAWVAAEDVAEALDPARAGREVTVLGRTDHDSYSFEFMRAVADATVGAIAAMAGVSRPRPTCIGFSEMLAGTKVEKRVLQRARELWR